ncbi:alpha/beta fold hydrolase [Aliarcobacter lanthieri]|uniref:alpha/beta fold hydrolase n=1 Tax=Aliarcobacter lanthieri TaxID=1355374 RepID=UPI0004A76330|nr:alpha/beta hydrolase [Aliarcobacter lanthieri]QKF58978.1 alpha/beta hydrolase family protein [Aliarcobacter lanthieri]
MKKEKIYFIPGLMTDIRLWKRVIPLLENKFDIVHTAIPNSTDFDEIVNILNKEFKEEKINILGFSLGGYIASYFTCKFPNKVARLFTVSATPGTTSKEELARRELKIEAFKNSDEFGLDRKKAISLVEVQNQNDDDLLQTIIDMFNDLGKEVFLTQLASTFNRIDLFENLRNLNIPIYMFYSNDDRLLDQISLKKLENEKHNINLLKRFGTSHNIPLEFPEDLAKHISKWIEE